MHTAKKTKEQVHLVNGMFTASEAWDVIQSLIDQKINFHKIQRLSWQEGNENCNTDYPDGRICQLLEDKKRIKAYIDTQRKTGKLLRIDGTLNISEVEI